MRELRDAQKSQKTNDVRRATPQQFRSVNGERHLVGSLENVDSLAYTEPGYARIEDALSPDEPEVITHSEAQRRAVRDVVASLSSFEQDVYYRHFGPSQMSSRDIAAELHGAVSHMTVQRAIDAIKAKTLAALAGGQKAGAAA